MIFRQCNLIVYRRTVNEQLTRGKLGHWSNVRTVNERLTNTFTLTNTKDLMNTYYERLTNA